MGLTQQWSSGETVNNSGSFIQRQTWYDDSTSSPQQAVINAGVVLQEFVVVSGQTLYRGSIKASRIGHNKCQIDVVYRTSDLIIHDGTADTEKVSMSTSSESAHIKNVSDWDGDGAIGEQIFWDGSQVAANDESTGIGRMPDGQVEGVDIEAPVTNLSVTIRKELDTVTKQYRQNIEALCYTVNNAAWKDWAAEEVLFLGPSYHEPEGDTIRITFRFLCRRTVQFDVVFIDDTNDQITKEGWRYYWNRTGVSVDISPGNGVSDPQAGIQSAHVAQVYEPTDWTDLGLDTDRLYPTD